MKQIIFPHIWKTGGTSLASIFYNLFSQDECVRVEDKPVESYQNTRFLTGHMPYGLHNVLSKPYTYIGLIREPIERVVSSYYFMKEQKGHPLYQLVNQLTLLESLQPGVHPYLDDNYHNHQTRIFAGIETTISKGRIPYVSEQSDVITDKHLEQAISNIKTDYSFVSTLEDMPNNCSKLGLIIGHTSEQISFPHLGKTSDRPKLDNINQQALKLIREFNGLDIQLYNYIRERL